jgi:hypothetical protein
MELSNFNVRELTLDEKININGGSKVGDFFAAVWDGIKEAYEWLENKVITFLWEKYSDYLKENSPIY